MFADAIFHHILQIQNSVMLMVGLGLILEESKARISHAVPKTIQYTIFV